MSMMTSDDFRPGWGHTDAQLQILSDMDVIYDEAGAMHGPRVLLDSVIKETDTGQFNDPGRARLRQYEEWGWLRDLSATADPGGVDAELTFSGRRFVEEIRARRNDALVRRRSMRQSVATWILEQHAEGMQLARYDNFLASRYAVWYGVGPIPPEEYGAATYWLREAGLAEGTGAQGHGLIAVKLTPLGESLIDSGRDLTDYVGQLHDPTPASATSYVTHVVNSPGTNIAAGSAGAQQQTNVTITREMGDEAIRYADLLERLLPKANPDVDARQVADNVRQAIATADPGKVRAALTGAQLAFASAIGTDAGNALWQGLHPLLKYVGMG